MAPIVGALPPPPGITPNFAHPKDVLRTVNFVTQSLCISLVTIFVLMRIYTRAVIQKMMYKEDWVCIVSWCFFIVYIADNIMFNFFGGGYHQWEVSQEDAINFQKVSYGGILVYGPTAYLIKLTILLFSSRLYSLAHKPTLAITVLILLMLAFYIPMEFAKIFICSPISAYWDRSAHPHATCLDVKTLYFADTAVSVITDIAVLMVPIPLIWGMNLSKMRKFKVMALLAAGGIACIASVARLVMLAIIINSQDGTLNTVALNLLAVAEVSIGLICACLPSLGVFCKHFSNSRKRKAKDSDQNIVLGTVGSGGKQVMRKGKFDNSLLMWTYVEVEPDSK
ncbi:hypothetical protein BKA61DRAFT_589855 [Leptodontidium sp. MPI-SDFR-AT-0119]|nr:hypothetical protein BKA61DRAFT_589855 [Leptodontidium sp. MPI-SDFR-AT-0119]